MKFKSSVFAQSSGSLAGTVFAHNKGGQYVRNRSIPINPATVFQQAVRNSLKTLTSRWQTLTDLQRAAWAIYAANVPLLNKLGDPRPIPALSMYVRCNSPRLTFVGPSAIVDDGPTVYSLATFPAPTTTYAAPNLTVAYDNTAEWAIADGGFFFVYVSTQQSPTINFWKGPYRFAGDQSGNTMTPPTSPALFTLSPVPATGNKIFVRYQASNADGRLSSSLTDSVTA